MPCLTMNYEQGNLNFNVEKGMNDLNVNNTWNMIWFTFSTETDDFKDEFTINAR